MKSSVIKAATAVAAFVGALGLAVPAASAAPSPAVTAKTQLSNRGDGGGNGDWATDAMTRTLTIIQTKQVGSTRTFVATITDVGHFVTIPHAFTPNQGGADAGLRIAELLPGTFTGKASYSFMANNSPRASLVPRAEIGTPSSGPTTTSLWYEQAFPAGTTFSGLGITTWGWNYAATAVSFDRSGGFSLCTQKWSDASTNNGGQDANSGNITGSCPSRFIF
jgi:hypothetical protein